MDCAVNIREARKIKGFTQNELAMKIGKTESSVAKYELGVTIPPLEVLSNIADALGVSVGYLLYGPNFLLCGDGKNLTYDGQRVGQAYEKATPPVQRTVEVALEPFMDDEAHT